MDLSYSYRLEGIDEAAGWLWAQGSGRRTWCFGSGMGSGKTTLIRALCRHIGVEDEISSPTFPIIQEYYFRDGNTEKTIAHMDWYRLDSEREAVNAGVAEALRTADLSLVEWPQKLPALVPANYLQVEIAVVSEHERTLLLHFSDEPAR